MYLPGLFDKDNVTHLPDLSILNFKGDINAKVLVHTSQVHAMATGTTSFKHVHGIVRLASVDSIESA
jgi:hypothetical protein